MGIIMNNEDKAKSILRSELRGMGIINGDDEMVWYSPNKDYKFIIHRSELNNYNNPYMPRYIINMNIFNDVGIKIIELKFSELDAIRILDNIQEFTSGDYSCTGDSIIIPINANNTLLNSYNITLENIFYMEDSTMSSIHDDVYERYAESEDETRFKYVDILMKLSQYNPIEERLVDRIKIKLTYDQIGEFAFILFFESIIDIDFPKEFDDVLNRIDSYVSLGEFNPNMLEYHLNRAKENKSPLNNDFMNPPIYDNSINYYNESGYQQIPYTIPNNIPEKNIISEKTSVSNQNSVPKIISLEAHNKGVMS